MSNRDGHNVTLVDPCVTQGDPLNEHLRFRILGIEEILKLEVQARDGEVVFVASRCHVPAGCAINRYSGYPERGMEDFTPHSEDVIIPPSEHYWLIVTTPSEERGYELFKVHGVMNMGEKMGDRVVLTFRPSAVPPSWVRRANLPGGDEGVLEPATFFEKRHGLGG